MKNSKTDLSSTVSFEIRDIAFGGAGVGRVASQQFKLPVEVEVSGLESDAGRTSTSTLNFNSCAAGDKGVACFIKGVIDGEKVRARVSKAKPRFMEAELVEVLEPSPHRIPAPCPYFLKCGGCAYQHIDYSHQLKIKEQQLREALRRIGGISDPAVRPIIPSPKPFHYRNRITVHVKDGALGFFAEKSRTVVEIDQCLLASEEINQDLQQLRSQRPHDGNYLLVEMTFYLGINIETDSISAVCGNISSGVIS